MILVSIIIYKVSRSKYERNKLESLSVQRSVPVISDPNNDIFSINESDDIINYLERI
jgi:glutathione S-transferase